MSAIFFFFANNQKIAELVLFREFDIRCFQNVLRINQTSLIAFFFHAVYGIISHMNSASFYQNYLIHATYFKIVVTMVHKKSILSFGAKIF